ncbi:hypothetical protein D3C74_445660 [compost metagenome]
MVWGSTMILKLTERFPIVITIGAAVLAWTAAKMLVAEPLIDQFFVNGWIKYGFEILAIIAVVGIGTKIKRKKEHLRLANQGAK